MQSEPFRCIPDNRKQLYVSRRTSRKNSPLNSCLMTPEDVDFEMQTGKSPTTLEISGMNQLSLEYFVQKYGATYRRLSFFHSQTISDFSPLGDLIHLENVSIDWNIRADKLWNMEKNTKLEALHLSDSKKLTLNPALIKTAPHLKIVSIRGSMFSNYPMESLNCFMDMKCLETLQLSSIRLIDKCVDALGSMPALLQFDFDAGMFTTEEIAYMVAKYPHLYGKSLRAYNTEDAIINDVRVCGFRKPGLNLPQQQKRLDKYIAEFEAMVEKYRNELAKRRP